MPDLTIDGHRVSVRQGATLLEAARLLGIEIPTLCFLEDGPHHTSCMVCLVEDVGSARLLPACATAAAQGQVVRTESERVAAARRTSLELLLGEHSGDCEAPCTRACPAHADIPSVIRRIARGDWDGALERTMERLPLAGTLAHICPAPCERACRRRIVDAPVAIRSLMRAASASLLPGAGLYTPRVGASTGKSVAVVGAGPAGLSAACFLARQGHRCVVFDEREQPGGSLRGLAASGRLPLEALDADVAVLRRMGVELRAGQRVEGERSVARLRDAHDALVIATGSASLAASSPAPGQPGVFVCGNAARSSPTTLAVRAVADARAVAHAVGLFLSGLPAAPPRRRFDSRRGRLAADDLALLAREARSRSERPLAAAAAASRRDPAAPGEALRCLRCDCAAGRSCRLRLLADRYGADGRRFAGDDGRRIDAATGGWGDGRDGPRRLSFESGKCIKCGVCVRIAERAGDVPGLAFVGRGFDVRVRPAFNGQIDESIRRSADECVARCPTGALVWERG